MDNDSWWNIIAIAPSGAWQLMRKALNNRTMRVTATDIIALEHERRKREYGRTTVHDMSI